MTDRLHDRPEATASVGAAASLEVRLQEAAGNSLDHAEFLELILQDELAVRVDRQLQRRVKAASFRELKTLDDFDWSFNPSIKKKQIFDLAAGRFVREARDVLLMGPPGVGKSFLAQAIGYQALKAGFMRALPVDLRRGPRLPARRGAGRRGQGAGPLPQARTAASSTTWA